jgi:hypothetical protein
MASEVVIGPLAAHNALNAARCNLPLPSAGLANLRDKLRLVRI